MQKLILIRHGESVWNHENRFTGWANIELTERGIRQMQELGLLLAQRQLNPDLAYTSRLRRCRQSNDILLAAMGHGELVAKIEWRLNERHYGALTGLSKDHAVRTYGAAAVRRWRRSFDAAPPMLDVTKNKQLLGHAYDDLPADSVPQGESLEQVTARVRSLWEAKLLPDFHRAKRTLVTAHGNSLRALIKLIEGLSEHDIASLEVANAHAYIYELNDDRRLVRVDCISSTILTPSVIL